MKFIITVLYALFSHSSLAEIKLYVLADAGSGIYSDKFNLYFGAILLNENDIESLSYSPSEMGGGCGYISITWNKNGKMKMDKIMKGEEQRAVFIIYDEYFLTEVGGGGHAGNAIILNVFKSVKSVINMTVDANKLLRRLENLDNK